MFLIVILFTFYDGIAAIHVDMRNNVTSLMTRYPKCLILEIFSTQIRMYSVYHYTTAILETFDKGGIFQLFGVI